MNGPGPGCWGVRSLSTGWLYLHCEDQEVAEYLRVTTGAADKYEIVQRVGDAWVASPCATAITPDPRLTAGRRVERFGDDDDVVRLAVRLVDPMCGVEVPPFKITAAEIRQTAERRWNSQVRKLLGSLNAR